MPTTDKRVDAYIARSADFAQPILRHIRRAVHAGCPEVEETLKWGAPAFMYKGIMAGMAAFKQHCVFGFWRGTLVTGKAKPKDAMGNFGRLTSINDLPPKKVLLAQVRKAKQVHDLGLKPPGRSRPRNVKRTLVVPSYFRSAVKKNDAAWATFTRFPYSKKKDYVEWVTDAKTDATRERRLQTTVAWLAQGKSRNWKYENC